MNKIYTLGTLVGVLFSSVLSLIAQTPTTQYATWKDNRKAAYTIIHDDFSNYVTGIYAHADPIATSRGIKFCFGAITNYCGANEWSQARTMIAHGHECINHSHNHKCGGNAFQCAGLTAYGEADFATELDLSTQLIKTNTGVAPRFFIHPYDAASDAVINRLGQLGYLGTRAGSFSTLNTANFTDFMRLNFHVFDGSDERLATLNPVVDEAIATGGYAVREFHGIDDGSYGFMTVANYTSHLNYVKSKMDDGSLWNATATEAITYKMQKDAFQPFLNFNTSTKTITINFLQQKNIDPSVLVTPVTLNVNLNGLTGIYKAKQNGVNVPVSLKNGVLSVNIYPHKGAIIFEREAPITPTPCVADGRLLREIAPLNLRNGASTNGINLSDWAKNTALFESRIQSRSTVNRFQSTNTPRQFFIERIKGYITFPTKTTLSFTIAGHEDVELYVSTDATPAKKRKVCGVKGKTTLNSSFYFANQTSAKMTFEAGKFYYVELWHLGTPYVTNQCYVYRTINGVFSTIAAQFLSSTVCPSQITSLAKATTLELQAQLHQDKAQLTWAVNAAEPIDYFEVEKANSNTHVFEKIETINRAVDTDTPQYFNHTDHDLVDGESVYRIKMVYQSGNIAYSAPAKVTFQQPKNYLLSPNPADDVVNIDLTAADGKTVDIAIFTLLGKVVKQERIETVGKTHHQMALYGFDNGQYLIKIQPQGKRAILKKLVIMH